jgi:hypothetical protein
MSEDKGKALVNIDPITGMFKASTIEGQHRIATMMLKSGMLPNSYRSPEMVLGAMMFANELGLHAFTALRQIAMINGTPSLYGDLPLALVQSKSKDLEYIREYFIDTDCNEICVKNKNLKAKVFGAVCVTKRKSAPHEHETFFTIDDKAKAGLKGPTWNSYERTMLHYRARSMNLKDSFPECLNGVSIAEYDYNVLPETTDGKVVDGVVISSVQHNGTPSRMDAIREEFVEPKSAKKRGVSNKKPVVEQVELIEDNRGEHEEMEGHTEEENTGIFEPLEGETV